MQDYIDLNIGLTNAWIGSLIIFLTMLGVMTRKELSKRLLDMSWYTPYDKKSAMASMVAMYGMMIFSIWVPLKIGSIWFYAGLCLYLVGYIAHMIALHNYATTPKNEAIRKGMYQISRNPLYFFYALMFLGLVVASLSLPLLIIWVIYNIFTHLIILGEERYCLKNYTESYQDYMQKVPRYFLFF